MHDITRFSYGTVQMQLKTGEKLFVSKINIVQAIFQKSFM